MREVDAHLDETFFAWMGTTGADGPFYYRVHSPVVLIEFDHHPGVVFDNLVPSATTSTRSCARPMLATTAWTCCVNTTTATTTHTATTWPEAEHEAKGQQSHHTTTMSGILRVRGESRVPAPHHRFVLWYFAGEMTDGDSEPNGRRSGRHPRPGLRRPPAPVVDRAFRARLTTAP